MKIVGIIPSRYQSSRLPGKPLVDICGKPMVWWVYQQAKKAEKFEEVYVATDDERIEKVCDALAIPCIMTSKNHLTATERLHEVSETIRADFYVQINGDEPLIDPKVISAVIPKTIPQDVEFGTNIITSILDPAQAVDSSNIKVVFDNDFRAMYMSRTPIPYPFKGLNFKYYKHVGIIGNNKKMLDFYANSQPGRFEKIEGIDTLRFLDYGKFLQFILVENCESLSVDTPKDLNTVRMIMNKKLENKEISLEII